MESIELQEKPPYFEFNGDVDLQKKLTIVVDSLWKMGANQVGIAGSWSRGEQKSTSDVDVIAVFPERHEWGVDDMLHKEIRKLPNGELLPQPFSVVITLPENLDKGFKFVQNLRHDAIWFEKPILDLASNLPYNTH